MKEFMLIFSRPGGTELSPEEMQNNMNRWFKWIDELKSKGIYKSGEALTPGGKIVKGQKALVTDGPFSEGKELVGGFFIIKTNSIEEATEIAKQCPDLALDGAVQVQEVMKF